MLNFRSFIWNNPYAKELPSLPVWPLACCCVDKLCCGLLLLLTRCRHTAGSHLLTSCFPNTKEGKILFHGHAQTFSKPDLALLQQICIILTEMYQTSMCVHLWLHCHYLCDVSSTNHKVCGSITCYCSLHVKVPLGKILNLLDP